MNAHIFCRPTITLSIKDRIRILFGSKIHLEIRMETSDELIEVIATETSVSIDRLIRLPRKSGGYAEFEKSINQ